MQLNLHLHVSNKSSNATVNQSKLMATFIEKLMIKTRKLVPSLHGHGQGRIYKTMLKDSVISLPEFHGDMHQNVALDNKLPFFLLLLLH